MDAILNFLGSDSIAAAVVVSALLGGAVTLVRLGLRDMYASPWWRMQRHWDD